MNNGKFYIKVTVPKSAAALVSPPCGITAQLAFQGTDEVIPEDEPVFILRASDRQASSILRVYQSKMRPSDNCWKGLQAVIEEFTHFRQDNPDKMKQPEEVYTS